MEKRFIVLAFKVVMSVRGLNDLGMSLRDVFIMMIFFKLISATAANFNDDQPTTQKIL